jgi:ferredoxin-NADP reductase
VIPSSTLAPEPTGAPAAPVSGRTASDFEGDLVVVARREEADGVVGVDLALPDGAQLPEWTPGAHVDLVLPNGLTRQYSLCGNPADRSRWCLGVLREADGRGGSRWVADELAPGSTLRVRGPRNNFPLLPAQGYVFVAGGIGITPLLPMIRAAEAAGVDWSLYYGGRTRSSMAFLDQLARYGDRVRLQPQDEVGLMDLAGALAGHAPGRLVYCCGPTGLIDAVEQRCRELGPGVLHVERFAAAPQVDAGEATEFEVVCDRTGITVTVPPELSVLEALENEGIAVLSSCTEGTCGTCETAVLEGTPDHRDSLLTDEERAAGDTMMICVSRCLGRRLVLDV